MYSFTNEDINLNVLKKRAYNLRWAEVEDGVIPLTAADPDFPAPEEVKDALIDYIKGGYYSYTPSKGFPQLKESMARVLKERKDEIIEPGLILPIDSAARGMHIIAKAVLNPGDEALVFDPVDFLFRTSMESAGAKVNTFPVSLREDGTINLDDLEEYITPKTKMIGLCNPHNPLGKVYPKKDLERILKLSEKYGFYIMNDEIWSDIVYSDAQFNSICSFGSERNERTISVFGFSKSFGLAGLRIACVYCQNEELFKRIVDASLVETTIGGVSSLSQAAAMTCLDKCYGWQENFLKHLEKNRDYVWKRLNNMPGVKCAKPQATYVAYADISNLGVSSEEFINYLRTKEKVAIVPGGKKYFGSASEKHIRICFATSREILAEGLNRVEKGVKFYNELKKNG